MTETEVHAELAFAECLLLKVKIQIFTLGSASKKLLGYMSPIRFDPLPPKKVNFFETKCKNMKTLFY